MKNRKGFTLIELMIVIAIIGILAAMAIPNFRKARESARQKACYSNLRVILGAIEMYNMDNSSMMDSLSTTALVSGKYLKAEPVPPETDCSYEGTNIIKNGRVWCKYHGDVEGYVPGSYKPN